MNTSQIEPSTTEAGLTTIEQANAQASAALSTPTISAKDALGLDESPRESLQREQEKVNAQAPQEKMQRDENGRFINPSKPKKDKAPKMRLEHLQDQLDKAKKSKDEAAV